MLETPCLAGAQRQGAALRQSGHAPPRRPGPLSRRKQGAGHPPEAPDECGNGVSHALRLVLVHSVARLQPRRTQRHACPPNYSQQAADTQPRLSLSSACARPWGPRGCWGQHGTLHSALRSALEHAQCTSHAATLCCMAAGLARPRPAPSRRHRLARASSLTCGSSTGWNLPCICPMVSGRSRRSVPTSTSTWGAGQGSTWVGGLGTSRCWLAAELRQRTRAARLERHRRLQGLAAGQRLLCPAMAWRCSQSPTLGLQLLPRPVAAVGTHFWHRQLEEHVAQSGVPALPVGRRPLQRCAPRPAVGRRRRRRRLPRRRNAVAAGRRPCCRPPLLGTLPGPSCLLLLMLLAHSLLRCLPLRPFFHKRVQTGGCQAGLRACGRLAAVAASAGAGAAAAGVNAAAGAAGIPDKHGGQRDVRCLLPLAHACKTAPVAQLHASCTGRHGGWGAATACGAATAAPSGRRCDAHQRLEMARRSAQEQHQPLQTRSHRPRPHLRRIPASPPPPGARHRPAWHRPPAAGHGAYQCPGPTPRPAPARRSAAAAWPALPP